MSKDRSLIIPVIFCDLIILTVVVLTMYRVFTPSYSIVEGDHLTVLVTFIVSFLASYIFNPAIVQERIVRSEAIVSRAFATCSIQLLFVVLIISVMKPFLSFPRVFIFTTQITFLLCLIVERLCIRRYLRYARSHKRNVKHVVLVGPEEALQGIRNVIETPEYGYEIAAIFCDKGNYSEGWNKLVKGEFVDLFQWLTENKHICEIFAFIPYSEQDRAKILSKFCDNHLIRLYYVPPTNIFDTKSSLENIGGLPLIARREEPLSKPENKFIKRTFDIVFSSVFLVFVFPFVWAIVGIIIKLQSKGPVFFTQKRTGIDGKVFKCIKFRSMHVNNTADTVQATKDDPRKFPFGDKLRHYNIDELPQFINVLLGDMSIVGPRPHMLRHTEEYSKIINHFMVRHLTKPGITGLAQVSGFRGETRYIDQMEGRVKMDIEYIENWTFMLDIKIIYKTIRNMIVGDKEAY